MQAPSPVRGARINEDDPLDPAWAYPKSKAETEAAIARHRGAIRTVTLRLAGVYDEDCRAAFIAQQIARIFERLRPPICFSGDLDAASPICTRTIWSRLSRVRSTVATTCPMIACC